MGQRRVGPGRPKGEAHYRSRCPDEDVVLARLLHREGVRLCDIARKFDTDRRTVHGWITCGRRMMTSAREREVRATLAL